MDLDTIRMNMLAGLHCGERNTCGDKKRYADESSAKSFARVLEEKYNKNFGAYPCVYCGFWHLGNRIDKSAISEMAHRILDAYGE